MVDFLESFLPGAIIMLGISGALVARVLLAIKINQKFKEISPGFSGAHRLPVLGTIVFREDCKSEKTEEFEACQRKIVREFQLMAARCLGISIVGYVIGMIW